MNHSDQEYREWDETFRAVIALYVVLKTDYWSKLSKRKDVQKSHLDFICDVEIRAKEAYQRVRGYEVFDLISMDPEGYEEPGVGDRWLMGAAFTRANLGPCGPYRGLYFKVKNDQDRAIARAKEMEGGGLEDLYTGETGSITN